MQELFISSKYQVTERSYEMSVNRWKSRVVPTKYLYKMPVYFIEDNCTCVHRVRISANKKYVFVNCSYFAYYRVPKSVYNKMNPCYHVY